MSFDYATINFLRVNTINGQSAPVVCNYRMGVDPTSNPGIAGGLYVTSASTQPTSFPIPLKFTPDGGLNIAENFKNDPTNCLTLSGSDITVNRSGIYEISVQLGMLINGGAPPNLGVAVPFTAGNIAVGQVLLNTSHVFMSPPGVNSGNAVISLTGTPVGGIYAGGVFIGGTQLCQLTAGQIINLQLFLKNDYCEITLTSAVTINLIQ